MPNICGMDPNIILAEIEAYAHASGLKVSTICQRAFNNAKFADRLRARIDRGADDLDRFRHFVAKNPVQKTSEDAA